MKSTYDSTDVSLEGRRNEGRIEITGDIAGKFAIGQAADCFARFKQPHHYGCVKHGMVFQYIVHKWLYAANSHIRLTSKVARVSNCWNSRGDGSYLGYRVSGRGGYSERPSSRPSGWVSETFAAWGGGAGLAQDVNIPCITAPSIIQSPFVGIWENVR
jgi:hypothetical protein